MDLSILIPARNEMFLKKTVDSLLENIRGKTEVIVVLDGQLADPPLVSDKRLKVIYNSVSIGQRAATNQACRLARGKWIMKIDAHCTVNEGFDVKVIDGVDENWTIVPIMYNLYGFDWVCQSCKHRIYQSPTPSGCKKCKGKMVREVIWKPRLNRRNEFYRFDTDLHFQYHSTRKKDPAAKGDFAESMSLQGSCFVITRKKYWELDICEENFGSWGQQGTEVACKTWLSGGKVMLNRKTWYSHMFRTQGGDFGFPYSLSGHQIDHARKYSKELFMDNKWSKQVYPLSWLVDRFKPLTNRGKHTSDAPDWHMMEGKKKYEYILKKGEEFYVNKLKENNIPMKNEVTAQDLRNKLAELKKPLNNTDVSVKGSLLTLDKLLNTVAGGNKKGIVFFTDNQLNVKLAHAVQNQLRTIGLPIVSASLKPMSHFGYYNAYLPLKRGYLTMFKEILSGLEASKSDIIFLCEHDVFYPKSHFDFVPPTDKVFYYNVNWWKVRIDDGFAVSWEAQQVSGICAYRKLLLDHYRKRVSIVEKYGYNHSMGFEPGAHNYKETIASRKKEDIPQDIYIDDVLTETWKSKYPYIDVRTGKNLSYGKWSLDDFRDKKTAINFKSGILKDIPGWNFDKGLLKPLEVV